MHISELVRTRDGPVLKPERVFLDVPMKSSLRLDYFTTSYRCDDISHRRRQQRVDGCGFQGRTRV